MLGAGKRHGDSVAFRRLPQGLGGVAPRLTKRRRARDCGASDVGSFGSMLSMRFAGGETTAIAVAEQVEVFKGETSLGGVEGLVEHRASVEGAPVPTPNPRGGAQASSMCSAIWETRDSIPRH